MPATNNWRRLTCAAALAATCSAMTASTAAALNPQPLPPRVSSQRFITQQTLSSTSQIAAFNPQPDPPGRR